MATSSVQKKRSGQSSDYLSVISDAASSVGYSTLKNEQIRAIEAFVGGKDVFISLPTGYGKSLCFALLPRVFDMIRGVDIASIPIIISPLISLIQDQVTNFNQKGISSVCVSDKQTTSKESRRNILKGAWLSANLHESRISILQFGLEKNVVYRYLHEESYSLHCG